MRKISICGLALMALGLTTGSTKAGLVTFEGFTPGTVNGQGGWTVEDSFGNSTTAFDQEVVDDGTGNTVWRLSNSVTGSFSDSPFSHSAPQVAGETGSHLFNDFGPDHTMPLSPPASAGAAATTKNFHSSFRFKSATDAAQSGLQLSVSGAAKQSPSRDSFFRITDDGSNGFDIFFYETGTVADPFGLTSSFPEVASDLAYDTWHTIDMYIEFVDGTQGSTFGNDIVTLLVDGVVVHTGSTWETYYRSGIDFSARLQAIDSLMFRPETATPANAGGGFFFDDVLVSNDAFSSSSAVPEPGSISLLAIGCIGMLGYARRRKQQVTTRS